MKPNAPQSSCTSVTSAVNCLSSVIKKISKNGPKAWTQQPRQPVFVSFHIQHIHILLPSWGMKTTLPSIFSCTAISRWLYPSGGIDYSSGGKWSVKKEQRASWHLKHTPTETHTQTRQSPLTRMPLSGSIQPPPCLHRAPHKWDSVGSLSWRKSYRKKGDKT